MSRLNRPAAYAFTTDILPDARQLTNQVYIMSDKASMPGKALWDTGASNSCISRSVIDTLKLIPTGSEIVTTPSGAAIMDVFLVDIELPNNITVTNVPVCGSEIGEQGLEILIGMDIIRLGSFAVSNYNGHPAFTFRVPSNRKIDFVADINRQNRKYRG